MARNRSNVANDPLRAYGLTRKPRHPLTGREDRHTRGVVSFRLTGSRPAGKRNLPITIGRRKLLYRLAWRWFGRSEPRAQQPNKPMTETEDASRQTKTRSRTLASLLHQTSGGLHALPEIS
jgi:hypothetical protein